jgi:glycosyltransferase involved in cell wall biosynthesis
MSEKLRVLWLARTIPVPLDSGERIYTSRLVGALGKAGAEVHYMGLLNPDHPAVGPEILDPSVRWEVIPGEPIGLARAMLSSRPVSGARFGTKVYEERIAECLASERYDAIMIDHYGMTWALPMIEQLTAGQKVAILHLAHDFETEVTHSIATVYRGNPVRKVALHLNARRTAVAERILAARSDLIVTLTEKDRELFRGIGAHHDFLVVPPGYDGPRRPERTILATSPRRVGIVGSYRWTAKQMNLTAFLEAADPIFARSGIELSIVGDAPDDYRAKWAGKLAASKFLGFVDDVGIFLDSCRLGLVVETIGGGFKLKVLDYALTRTPVGALTPALEGQSPDVIKDFIVTEDPADLADMICTAIDDVDRLNTMHESAYRAADPLYDWGRNGRALRSAIEKSVAKLR